MKMTIESTSKVVNFNGVECRVWEGVSERGVKLHCFIARVGIALDADGSQFETELLERRAPSPEVAALPLRMIL